MIFTQYEKIGHHGRTGILHTRAGDVLTPTFMPDGTRGAVKSLTPEQVESTGVGVVLANTYHLHLSPGEKVIKELGGLHAFANRKGPMLTDSGGFQVFSLGSHVKIAEEGVHFRDPKTGDKHFISPEISMQIQLDLGADMIVAFDHLVGLDESVSDTEIREAFDRTHRWLDRCIVEFERLTKGIPPQDRPLLFGVVQGGLNLDLRKKSLEYVQNTNVDGIAIGGLSVGETREEMRTVLEALAPLYDIKRPRFLLGVGTPEDLKIAVANGIDMLDCVLPTRNARHGMVWRTPEKINFEDSSTKSAQAIPSVQIDDNGQALSHNPQPYKTAQMSLESERMQITNKQFKDDPTVIDETCDCYTCANGFSRAFLRQMFKSADPLGGMLASIHNLRYMMRLCEAYRRLP